MKIKNQTNTTITTAFRIILCSVLFTGCAETSQKDTEATGMLAGYLMAGTQDTAVSLHGSLAVRAPANTARTRNARSSASDIQSYKFTLSGANSSSETGNAFPGQSILFENLTPQLYNIAVDAFDADGLEIFKGAADVAVEAGSLAQLTLTLDPTTGDLEVFIEVPDDAGYPASCMEILNNGVANGSGYYTIDPDGDGLVSPSLVYCDMDSNGGGWTRIADFDGATGSCPGDWTYQAGQKVCRGASGTACHEAVFSNLGLGYSEVRGYARALQYYSMDAFHAAGTHDDEITEPYVDGISITYTDYGKQHIWTYAVGLSNSPTSGHLRYSCPAVGGSAPPSFVGADFFCDSGNYGNYEGVWYSENPIFETNSSPWWFQKTLSAKTDAAVEVRLCSDQNFSGENVGLKEMEIFIR